jgi:hypothetical protein
MESRQIEREQNKAEYVLSDEFYEKALGQKPQRSRTKNLPSKNFKRWLYVIILCVTIIVGIFGFSAFSNDLDPISTKLEALGDEVDFSLYKLGTYPSGYSVDSNSIKLDQEIVFMTLKSSESPNISISQQAKPAMEIDKLFNEQEPPQSIPVKSGRLIITRGDETLNAILVTDSSWINFSAASSLQDSTIINMAQDLQKI